MKKIKKTTGKRLALDKEAIRDLASHELTHAAGGDALNNGVHPLIRTFSCPQ